MTPSELLRRLRALDWSATPLQHRLAASAAALELETTMQPPIPANSNLVSLAARGRPKRTCWTSLCNLETGARVFTSSHFSPGGAWGWICEVVSAELGCDEDAVGCAEDPEGGDDLVTVSGEAVYSIEHWSTSRNF